MNERYIQAVIVGVLVGGAILLAEMIDAGNVQGPANAESSSASLVFSESAKQRDAVNQLAVQLAQIETMDDPSQMEMLRELSTASPALALLAELKRIERWTTLISWPQCDSWFTQKRQPLDLLS